MTVGSLIETLKVKQDYERFSEKVFNHFDYIVLVFICKFKRKRQSKYAI